MFPIIDELSQINSFQSVVLPTAKRMYEAYGYRAPSPANFEEDDRPISLNGRNKLDMLRSADLEQMREQYRIDSEAASSEADISAITAEAQ